MNDEKSGLRHVLDYLARDPALMFTAGALFGTLLTSETISAALSVASL